MHVFKIYFANYLNNPLIYVFQEPLLVYLSFFQHYFRGFYTPAAARVFHTLVVCGALVEIMSVKTCYVFLSL